MSTYINTPVKDGLTRVAEEMRAGLHAKILELVRAQAEPIILEAAKAISRELQIRMASSYDPMHAETKILVRVDGKDQVLQSLEAL
jgi:hypothetical protein